MNYPLISEYIESIRFAEENFDKLKALRPVLDDGGNPIMSSGNYAVVFKMEDSLTNECFAIKCFIKDEPKREENYIKISSELQFVDSPYILKVEYLRDELFVNSQHSDQNEFPVLKMPWVEGKTLSAYISENYDNSYIIAQLTYNFCKLGSWLLSQDFAHGDLKPDNIIIKENGIPVLVDYDGMFVPAMRGSAPQEIGSPGFRHPQRLNGVFDEHIDDFAIAAIAMSLRVLSQDSSAFYTLKANDFSLFSEEDYTDLAQSEGIKHILKTLEDNYVKKLWGLLLLVLSEANLSSVSFRLLSIPLPREEEDYSSICSLSDNEKEQRARFVGPYLLDKSGKRLLRYGVFEDTFIPEGVEIVCSQSLQGHRSRTRRHITLPESLKAIGAIAFANNEGIETMTIPSGVEYIEPNNPFGGCKSLSDIQVLSPNFVLSGHCLYNADYSILYSSLFGVAEDCLFIHPNTKIIAANAFWGQEYKKIVLPDGLQMIGHAAFKNCASLEEMFLPDSIEAIEHEAFCGCTLLKEIHLPTRLKRIGSMVFHNCKSLISLNVPTSVEFIGMSVFSGCESLKELLVPDTVKTFGPKRELDKKSFIHEGFGGSEDLVRFSCNGMLQNCSSLESVHLPSSLRIIKTRDFYGCKSLKQLQIPEGTVTIEGRPFSMCTSLERVSLPSTLRGAVPEHCFDGCSSLKLIEIPEGIEAIEEQAFDGCISLEQIDFPSTLRVIGKRCFNNCTSLKSITVPDGVETIDRLTFAKCSTLERVSLPSSMRVIGGHCFDGCDSLKSIIVPEGVEAIEGWAFFKCISLERVSLPSSLRVIGEYCFDGCSSLKSIIVPEGVKTIENDAFRDCTALEQVILPSTLQVIPRSCFARCSSLKTIIVPEGVESIEIPFMRCTSLETVELPSSLKTIKGALSRAFWHCPSLKMIINHSSVNLDVDGLIQSYPELTIKYDNDIYE